MRKSVVSFLALTFGLVVTISTSQAAESRFKYTPNLKLDAKHLKLEKLKLLPNFDVLKLHCNEFDKTEKKAATARKAYALRIQICLKKSFSIADQKAAGCQPTHTLAKCNKKLLRWCTKSARVAYFSARGKLFVAAKALINTVKARILKYNISI